MNQPKYECHLVCGPPAAGKTTYARVLADQLGACLLDSDQVAERLVKAGLKLAGLSPDDRDSAAYKSAYRDAVYETLFDLAREHLERGPVIIVGPFTHETGEPEGLAQIELAVGQVVRGHFVWCAAEERRRRIETRGASRDFPKLENWSDYLKSCREEPPSWPHKFVNTSLDDGCPPRNR